MPLIILLYGLFGSIFTAAKVGLDHAEPFFLVGSRMVASGIILLTFLIFTNRQKLILSWKEIGNLVALGFFGIYLTNGCEFWGMKYISSSKASFIYSLSPFFSAILSYFVFGETMGRRKLLGLTIGLLGFIPVLTQQGGAGAHGVAQRMQMYAELAVTIAAMANVCGWTVMRRLVHSDVSPLVANAYSMLFGGIMSLIHSGFVENWEPIPLKGEPWLFVQTTVWMIGISSIVCYNLFGYLLKTYTVTFLSFSGFMTPFFAALFSWIVIGETVSYHFFLSAAIVFSGVFLFNQEELEKRGSIKEKEKKVA